MPGSEELYKVAYNAHYKSKDYKTALNTYLRVIQSFPHESEAKYARQQLDNLLKIPQFILEIDEDVKDIFDELKLEKEQKESAERDAAEKREADERRLQEREAQLRDLVLTTCPCVEGFSITKQLGLVFGEVVFKSGFLKSLSASIDNFVDVITAGDQELSGTTKLLNDARTYAIEKMKNEAVKKGANAIIGIDSESSFGGDIIHVSIMGTAVFLEKVPNVILPE